MSAAAVTGTFAGLPDGPTVTLNGVPLRVNYTATGVVLSLVADHAPTGVSAGGPYAIAEGDGLTVSAPAASDPDRGPLTYTWDVNGDGTFGDESFGGVSDGGRTVAFTPAALAALGLADGTRSIPLAVRV